VLFGVGGKAHAAVSRRPLISLDTIEARTEDYTYDAGFEALPLVQRPFSGAPRRTRTYNSQLAHRLYAPREHTHDSPAAGCATWRSRGTRTAQRGWRPAGWCKTRYHLVGCPSASYTAPPARSHCPSPSRTRSATHPPVCCRGVSTLCACRAYGARCLLVGLSITLHHCLSYCVSLYSALDDGSRAFASHGIFILSESTHLERRTERRLFVRQLC
jgi:hypothetical protein